LEEAIEAIKVEKNSVVKSQRYEEAAQLRDKEKKLIDQLDRVKDAWEEESKAKRHLVSEEHIGEVIAQITGIPINKVNMDEGQRILKMGTSLKGRIVGQDDAVKKLVKAIQRTRVGLK